MTEQKTKGRGGKRANAGRKPGGEARISVELPLRVVEWARAERERRLPERVSIPWIIAERCLA